MSNPIIREHNTETDEVIDREMTDTEAADYAAIVESVEIAQVEAAAKAEAKAALLERLGITAEEAQLLLA